MPSINLQVQTPIADGPFRQSYDLIITAVDPVDIDGSIFVFRSGVYPALQGESVVTDTFSCIADPVDMEEMPNTAEAPNEGFYRRPAVHLRFRSRILLDETLELIKKDVDLLIKTIAIGASHNQTETYVSSST